MPSFGGSGRVQKALVLLTVSIGCSAASRTLQDAMGGCGMFLLGDLLTDSFEEATPGTQEACLEQCEASNTCTALTVIPSNGRCFLKTAAPDFPVTPRDNRVSYFVCTDNGSGSNEGGPPGGGGTFENIECDMFLADTDLPGGNLGEGPNAATPQDCLESCEEVDGCNAVVRISNGRCFLKNLDLTVESLGATGLTSYAICPGSDTGGNGGNMGGNGGNVGGSEPDVACDEFLTGFDITGSNLGPSTPTASAQACLNLCNNNDACNAIVRLDNGRCFQKNIEGDIVGTELAQATSYAVCPDTMGSGDGPTDGGPTDGGPMAIDWENVECDTFLVDTDLPSGTIGETATASQEGCLADCEATEGCNSFVRIENGRCFLKDLPVDVVSNARGATVSYARCSV